MNAAELAANHKVLVSKDYDGDVALATWKELNFKPKASPYSDWTLYGSGDIEIPAEYQNCDNVHVERLSVRCDEDDLVVVTLRREVADAAVDGFALHDHTGCASEGIVIDATMAQVGGPVAQIVDVYFGQAFLLCSLDDALVERTGEQFWQHGDDVDAHYLISLTR